MELKWAWRRAQPRKSGNVPNSVSWSGDGKGGAHPSSPSLARQRGGRTCVLWSFLNPDEGSAGTSEALTAYLQGETGKTSAGNKIESWDSSFLGRGAKDAHKIRDFPAISPWNASLSSLSGKQETSGLCGSVGIGVSCPRSHHPVWTRERMHPCAGRAGLQNLWNRVTTSRQERGNKAGTASSSVFNKTPRLEVAAGEKLSASRSKGDSTRTPRGEQS